jgi:formate hydrogenlyase subunit 3/multisubunit Na+/H+ antiporter MnhD subunit
MAILGVPVLGMLIAVVVIYIKKPNNMTVVFGVILFVAVQYIIMMFFFMKKVEMMVEKEEAACGLESDEKPESHEVEEREDQLDPEEKRIFPLEADNK